MPFPYYERLSSQAKAIYRKSDAISSISIKNPGLIFPQIRNLRTALAADKRKDVMKYSAEICRLICKDTGAGPLTVKIKSRRPSDEEEELQGLYEMTEGETPVLTVWMKTAVNARVVAFKSFLRTLLHELCHHLDYSCFKLEDSLHTEGFFRRESDLYKKIVPVDIQAEDTRKKVKPEKPAEKSKRDDPGQLEFF